MTSVIPHSLPVAKGERFYRLELDLLRLFAFTSVFLAHGPKLSDSPNRWRHIEAVVYNRVFWGCVHGLCLFFFLSSFLITELLLREKEGTGAIHLRWFYIRRVLRIWPLYYFGVALAVVTPFFFHVPSLAHWQQLALVLLVGYLIGINSNPFNILWSISVEELFYLVWPYLAKGGRSRLLRASALTIVFAPFMSCFQADAWRNPLAQFLFFGVGGVVAITMRHQEWKIAAVGRISLFGLGLFCWSLIDPLTRKTPHAFWNPLWFLIAAVGCVLIFLAFYGFRPKKTRVTEALLYLGRISYGLYVFHTFVLVMVERYLWGSQVNTVHLLLTQIVALAVTISAASISYRFLEKPFLAIKDRFAFVQTRPAS